MLASKLTAASGRSSSVMGGICAACLRFNRCDERDPYSGGYYEREVVNSAASTGVSAQAQARSSFTTISDGTRFHLPLEYAVEICLHHMLLPSRLR